MLQPAAVLFGGQTKFVSKKYCIEIIVLEIILYSIIFFSNSFVSKRSENPRRSKNAERFQQNEQRGELI